MRVIGRNRGETYPRPPQGLGAASPFAQLGLSANVPFVAGDEMLVPFDTVIYQSRAFGTLSGGTFFIPFGVYLVTIQLDLDTTPTQLDITSLIASGSDADAAAGTAALGSIALTLSTVRLGSETPGAGPLPCSVVVAIEATGGGNGNIVSGPTKLFVWQLQEFQAAP